MSSNEDLKSFIEQLITQTTDKTNEKIDSLHTSLKTEIGNIRNELSEHTNRIEKVENEIKSIDKSDKIEELSLQIELLKQDRLRNNIRLTGLPPVAFNDPDEAILRIDDILQTELIPSDYIVHADRNKSSLILSFTSHSLKRHVMDQMRKKQTLLVEEIYDNIKSNSRIYMNDQLTPYFAKVFQSAWQAKKAGAIYSASSLGGRIRVRKFENGPSHIIETETQLKAKLDMELMDTQHAQTEATNSQQANDTQSETPKSADSAEARKFREKNFTHIRRPIHPSNRSNQPQSSNKNSFRTSTRPNNRQTQIDFEPRPTNNNKRNNRYVNSLEYKSQQPTDKRRQTAPDQQSAYDPQYRRNYQKKLLSYTR